MVIKGLDLENKEGGTKSKIDEVTVLNYQLSNISIARAASYSWKRRKFIYNMYYIHISRCRRVLVNITLPTSQANDGDPNDEIRRC